MKILMSLGIVITLSLVSGSVKARAAGCDALGNVRFICDQLGPEDLVAVPGSEWVLSSGMAANGAIRLINQRDKSTTVLFPSETSTERPNKKIYDSCPGPIGFEGDKFRAHGLYLRAGRSSVHTLFPSICATRWSTNSRMGSRFSGSRSARERWISKLWLRGRRRFCRRCISIASP